MQEKRVRDLIDYLRFAEKQYSLCLSIHFNSQNSPLSRYTGIIGGYNSHRHPFCMAVKRDYELSQVCRRQQSLIYSHLTSGMLCGSCCCGMKEYVIPVQKNGKILGAVCCCGYCDSVQSTSSSVRRICRRYGKNPERILMLVPSLSQNMPDAEKIQSILNVAADLLSDIISDEPTNREAGTGELYADMISYIESNYLSDLSVADIAAYCHCSISTVNHSVKRYSGKSVSLMVNELRIRHARLLLSSTCKSVTEIAAQTGFCNPNYFTAVFKSLCGTTPKLYRHGVTAVDADG